jgi:hypothetical protein
MRRYEPNYGRQQMPYRRVAPSYAPPTPVYQQAPAYAPPQGGGWRRGGSDSREWQRRHDDAYRNLQRRQREADRYAASQANSAAAQAAQAQLLLAQQQLAALQAQQAAAVPAPNAVVTAPATPTMVMPPSMPAPQPDVSPGNATQDMGPTQDAAAAAGGGAGPGPADAGAEHPGHAIGRKVIIALVIGGVAFGGYKFMKSRKKGGGGGGAKPHAAMHGSRRRRRR